MEVVGGVMKDISLWEEYVKECQKGGTTPDLSDYQVWLSEKGVVDEELEQFYKENLNVN